MINFTNGESITGKEAAALIRKEGKLTTKNYINRNGARCAVGVLEEWSLVPISLFGKKRIRLMENHTVLLVMGWNDRFRGTNSERAEYMAQKFEALEE